MFKSKMIGGFLAGVLLTTIFVYGQAFITAPDGNVTTPGYAFQGARESGMWRDGSGDIAFSINKEQALKVTPNSLVLHDADAEDFQITFDGNAQDYYIAMDDSSDDLLIGVGSTVGVNMAIRVDENREITLHNGGASDAGLIWDGNAQDFYISLDDNVDDLVFGVGTAAGTTPSFAIDQDQNFLFQAGSRQLTEVITGVDTVTVLQCGTEFYMDNATGFEVDLPVAQLGCKFRYTIVTNVTSGNHTWVTNSSDNIIIGGISEGDVTTNTDGPKSIVGDLITVVGTADTVGDWFELWSDGTSWFFFGRCQVVGCMTIGST